MGKKNKKAAKNRTLSLIQAFDEMYAAERANAKKAMAKLFMETPVVGPRELVEQAKGLVQPTKTLLEVQGANADNVAEFSKMPDGGLHVGVSMNSWGAQFADINLTPEQFAAFKQWVMEN